MNATNLCTFYCFLVLVVEIGMCTICQTATPLICPNSIAHSHHRLIHVFTASDAS